MSGTVAGVPTGNAFDKYGSSSAVVRRLMGRFTRTLDELVGIAAPASVLDVGCGEGVLTRRLAARLAGAVVGVDLPDPGLRAHWEAAVGASAAPRGTFFEPGPGNAPTGARAAAPGGEPGALFELGPRKAPSDAPAHPPEGEPGDLATAAVDTAPGDRPAPAGNLRFAAMRAEALAFDHGEFDLVCALEVLEHVGDPDAVLAEMTRVAARWVLVSVPREPLWRALNLARGAYVAELGNTPGHVQHFGARSIVRAVARHAEVVAVRAPLPWTMLLARVG